MYDMNMNTEQIMTDFDSLAVACKALSHPARLVILQTLSNRGAWIDVARLLILAQPLAFGVAG